MRESRYVAEELAQPGNRWAAELLRSEEKGWLAAIAGWSAKIVADRRVILAARIVLGSIFLVSAIGKLIDVDQYSVHAVYEFNILPVPMARIYGLALPFIELGCALGLLFGVFVRLSGFGIALLSVSFFLAKAIILLQGQDIACGCFGPITSTLASVSIFADPPMLLVALGIMLSPKRSSSWLSIGRGFR